MVFPLCGQKEKARFTHSGGISLICEKSKLKGISSPCFLLTQIFFMALTHHRHIYMYMYKGPPFCPFFLVLNFDFVYDFLHRRLPSTKFSLPAVAGYNPANRFDNWAPGEHIIYFYCQRQPPSKMGVSPPPFLRPRTAVDNDGSRAKDFSPFLYL